MITLSYSIFLFILAFAPLAFASVEHWSMMTVEILSSVAFLILLVGLKRDGLSFLRVPGGVPLLLILGFMLIQLIPFPPSVIKWLSPQGWEVYRLVYEQGGGVGWISISVNQKATLQEFLRISSYGVFYVLTIQLLRSGRRIRKTLEFVVVLALVIASIAILQQFTADGRIYWIRSAPGGEPGGPWVNINQYAAFIAAISPLVLGLFLFYRPRAYDKATVRQQIVVYFSSPQSSRHQILGFGFILMNLSVFISLCRGGIVAIVLSMLLFILLVGYKRRSFRNITLWACLCIALLFVTSFGWQPIIDRFGTAFDAKGVVSVGRMTVWSDSLAIFKDFPLLGAGFGTFNDIYPSYKTIPLDKIWDHAHNDYLELLTDGGLIGFTLAAWFCLAVLLHGWKKISVRGDRFAVLVGIGSITSICALLIHSIFDFNLHNGAVGLYFFFLCGLLVACVNTQYDTHRAVSALDALPERVGLLLTIGTSLLLITTLATQNGILIANNYYSRVKALYVTRHLSPVITNAAEDAVKKAQKYDPLEGLYPYYLGNLSAVQQHREEALAYYLQASRKQPLEGIYLQRIGMILPPGSEKAHEFMQESYRRLRNKNEVAYDWVERLLVSGERELAAEVLSERFRQTYPQSGKIVSILEAHDFSREEIYEIIPHAVLPWILFGEYLERIGKIEEAGYYFDNAAELSRSEPGIESHWFRRIISFYRRHDQPDKALAIIRLAVEKKPEEPLFHLWLGDHYYDEGITYRAKEEYKRAAMIDPTNETYQKRLLKVEQQK